MVGSEREGFVYGLRHILGLEACLIVDIFPGISCVGRRWREH